MSSQRTPPIAIDNARDIMLDSIIPIEELRLFLLTMLMAESRGKRLKVR